MGVTLKVVGEYVTLKVKDLAGADVINGYFKGAVVENVADDSAQHHIDNGLAEAVASSKPESEPAADDVPKGNASREDWAVYAAIKGAPNEETRPVEEGGLKQTELRDKYGK